ncbi:hypothetical protein [Streptomyces sp. NPDC046909]|uniref:hypothetical protein n=1 Tax=Streptomyces sp. NPDC046909 TaxID=3155617 RepID=UPI0034082325
MPTYENAVALRFADPATAHQAFRDLAHLGSTAELHGAALIERLEDGTIRVPSVLDTDPRRDGPAGGLVGSLMSILGGPLGPVMGWGIGAAIGDNHDHRHDAGSVGAVSAFTPDVPPGGTAVLAEVVETDTETLNLLAMQYDAVLERRPADAVRAELKAIEEEAEGIRRQGAKAGFARRLPENEDTARGRYGPGEADAAPERQLAA